MKIHTDLIQGSDEWLAIRKGKPTASRFSDIITAAKGELSKSAAGYIRELIGECFVPTFDYGQSSWAMQRGTDLEPEARDAFRAETGLEVREVGFVVADDGICGCSPDGLIYDPTFNDGNGSYLFRSGVEIKCPTPKVHVGYVLDGGLPLEYKQQVHGSMVVTGLDHWHFWSYFPGMRHHHVIVRRDEYTDKLADALGKFVADYRKALADATPKLSLAYRKEAA